jgi:hypothetical protein
LRKKEKNILKTKAVEHLKKNSLILLDSSFREKNQILLSFFLSLSIIIYVILLPPSLSPCYHSYFWFIPKRFFSFASMEIMTKRITVTSKWISNLPK